MTAQLQARLDRMNDSILIGESRDLTRLDVSLKQVRSLKGLLPLFELFHTRWVNQVEPLGTNGLRFSVEPAPSPEREQALHQLHALLERVANTSLDQYWDSGGVNFVPSTNPTEERAFSSTEKDFDIFLVELERLPLSVVIPVFTLFHTGWITQMQSLERIGIPYVNTNGIRFSVNTAPSPAKKQSIRKLREILELVTSSNINIYWGPGYIDLVPI